MAEVPADEVPQAEASGSAFLDAQAEKEELFCTYAAMILKDSELDISEDNINTLIKAGFSTTLETARKQFGNSFMLCRRLEAPPVLSSHPSLPSCALGAIWWLCLKS